MSAASFCGVDNLPRSGLMASPQLYRAKAVLPWGFVARSVEDRLDTLPRSRLAQGKTALGNSILSRGLVSK